MTRREAPVLRCLTVLRAVAVVPVVLAASATMASAAGFSLPPGFEVPEGVSLPAGASLPSGASLPAGVNIPSGLSIPSGMSIPSGVNIPSSLPAGVQLPAGVSLPGGFSPSAVGGYAGATGIPTGAGIPADAYSAAAAGGYGGGSSPLNSAAQGVAIRSGGGASPQVIGGGAAPSARPKFLPYLDVQQYSNGQIHGVGDSVTYTEVSVGLSGELRRRRIVGSIAYRFNQRFAESGRLDNSRSHDGVARAQIILVDNLLTLDTGGQATQTRDDPGGAASQLDTGTAKNVSQVYNVFAAPALQYDFGELSTSLGYRFGYVVNTGTTDSLLAGEPPVQRFTNSISHQGTFNIGMKRSSLPFDWSISSQYARETTNSLAQRFEQASVTAQVVVPVFDTIAAVGHVGYELTRTTQGQALRVAGVPVVDSKGNFVTDPSLPHVLTYDVKGLTADGGLIWTPTRRTRVELRAGYRYDGFSLVGDADIKTSNRDALHVTIFDKVQTFGQGLTTGLQDTPTNFNSTAALNRTPLQTCVFSETGGSAECQDGTLGNSSSAAYRNRGINITYSHSMRGSQLQLAAGYERRNYFDQVGVVGSLNGVVDQSIFLQAGYTRQLARNSGINFALSGNLFKNGQVGVPDVLSGALDSSYFRTFGRGLRAEASFGIEASKTDGIAADISARGRIGMRYEF